MWGEQPKRTSGVFGSDDSHFAQDAQRAKCNVLEITDRGRDHVQRAGHSGRTVDYCTIAGCALTESSSRAPP